MGSQCAELHDALYTVRGISLFVTMQIGNQGVALREVHTVCQHVPPVLELPPCRVGNNVFQNAKRLF